MTRPTLALVFVCTAHAACTRGTQAAPLRLGTTTTVEQSGALALLDSLHPMIPVRAVVGAAGTILRSAAAGYLVVVTNDDKYDREWFLNDPAHWAIRCRRVT